MTKKPSSITSVKHSKPKSHSKNVIFKSIKSAIGKKNTKSKSQSKKNSSAKSKGVISASTIGASKMAKLSGSKCLSGKSYEASNVIGRPKLCQRMGKLTKTKGAIKLGSIKEMNKRGFKVDGKMVNKLAESLRKVSGPKGKQMVLKMICLNQCTPRYKVTMERYSLKIMRFIGKKPLMEIFPKVFDIFLVKGTYYIFMGTCGDRTLYELVVKKRNIPSCKVRKWMHQLTEGVKELQKYGIAHRFIRLKHLMLDKNDHLKIVGWSKSVLFWDAKKKKALYQHQERRARKNNFLPPEAFHRLYDPSKADVWVIGVVLITLTTHRYPFHVRAKVKFTSQWRDFVKKHPINPIIRSLCNKIFVIDTKKRIHAREMLTHSYFKVSDGQLVNQSVRGKPLHSFSAASSASQPSKPYASFEGSKHSGVKLKSKSKTSLSGSQHSPGQSASHSVSQSGSHSVSLPSSSAASKSNSMTSGSVKSGGYSQSSTVSSANKASRTSHISKSTVGASQTSKTPTSSASKEVGTSSKSSKKKIKSLKASFGKSKSSNLKKSKLSISSKGAKSVKPKSKSIKPKSIKPKSVKSTTQKITSLKSKSKSTKPKSVIKEKSLSTSKKSITKGGLKEFGSKSKAESKIDGVSKQEMEAEKEDAEAEAEQAMEEAAEPEMEEVAKEYVMDEGKGEEGDFEGSDAEGVADQQDMQAPEEAANQAIPEEMVPEEGQQQDVDENAASQMIEGEGADGVEGAEGAIGGELEGTSPDEGKGGEGEGMEIEPGVENNGAIEEVAAVEGKEEPTMIEGVEGAGAEGIEDPSKLPKG